MTRKNFSDFRLKFEVDGNVGKGHSEKRLSDAVNADIKKWKLSDQDPRDRLRWRGTLKQIVDKSNPTCWRKT